LRAIRGELLARLALAISPYPFEKVAPFLDQIVSFGKDRYRIWKPDFHAGNDGRSAGSSS